MADKAFQFLIDHVQLVTEDRSRARRGSVVDAAGKDAECSEQYGCYNRDLSTHNPSLFFDSDSY
jgi:hypothetical protein